MRKLLAVISSTFFFIICALFRTTVDARNVDLSVVLFKHKGYQGFSITQTFSPIKDCITLGPSDRKTSSIKVINGDQCVRVCLETCDVKRKAGCRPVFVEKGFLGHKYNDKVQSLRRCRPKNFQQRSDFVYDDDATIDGEESNEVSVEKRRQMSHRRRHSRHQRRHSLRRSQSIFLENGSESE